MDDRQRRIDEAIDGNYTPRPWHVAEYSSPIGKTGDCDNRESFQHHAALVPNIPAPGQYGDRQACHRMIFRVRSLIPLCVV